MVAVASPDDDAGALALVVPAPGVLVLPGTMASFGHATALASPLHFPDAILTHAPLPLIGAGAITATSALAVSIPKIARAAVAPGPAERPCDLPGGAAAPGGSPARRGRRARPARHSLLRGVEDYLTSIVNPVLALLCLAAFPQLVAIGRRPVLGEGKSVDAVHAAIAILRQGVQFCPERRKHRIGGVFDLVARSGRPVIAPFGRIEDARRQPFGMEAEPPSRGSRFEKRRSAARRRHAGV